MLEVAKVGKDDIVYDPACGSGHIPIMAVKKFGAKRAVGFDLDPERIKEGKEYGQVANVIERVEFRVQDFLEADLAPATVVAIYLPPKLNLRLRPKLFRDLRPGTRVVSLEYDMGEWAADVVARCTSARARRLMIHLWVMPARVGGVWEWTSKLEGAQGNWRLTLEQEFQSVRGFLAVPGREPIRIVAPSLKGTNLSFTATVPGLGFEWYAVKMAFAGKVDGERIRGRITQHSLYTVRPAESEWTATRRAVDLAGSWKIELKVPERQALGGTLVIARKEGHLAATYAPNSRPKPVPLRAFYAWGSSIRFDVPVERRRPLVFRGSLGEKEGAGTVHGEGCEPPVPWTARRAR